MASERPYAVGDYVLGTVAVSLGAGVPGYKAAVGRVGQLLEGGEMVVQWGWVLSDARAVDILGTVEREADVGPLGLLQERFDAGITRFRMLARKEAPRDGE